jgi:hypothetical protein
MTDVMPNTEVPQDDTTINVDNIHVDQPTDLVDNIHEVSDPPEDPELFDRDYVEKLRDENAKYRQRARTADQLGQRLHAELVRATGRLADPTDLAFDPEHLDDADALGVAIDELLAVKPHLASRKPTGQIGQGATPSTGTVDLAEMLRQRAR